MLLLAHLVLAPVFASPATNVQSTALVATAAPLATLSADSTAATSTEAKSPGVALALSLGSTLGGIATGVAVASAASAVGDGGWVWGGVGLTWSALAVGPSIGHYYTGDVGRGLLMTTLRLGATGMMVGGGVLYVTSSCFLFCDEPKDDGSLTAGMILMVGGAVSLLALAVWDIIDAPYAAQRHNEESGITVGVSPTMIPGPDGAMRSGLALSGRF